MSLNSVESGAPEAGRVTVLCQDVPYPANHGGKLDLWNLVRGLHDQGMTIQLVCWPTRAGLTADVRKELAKAAGDVVEVRRRDGWWRLLRPRYPPRMHAFMPSRLEREALKRKVHAFAPDWLLFDHWAAYLPARMLATACDRPLVYRSQNVEHRYYRELGRLAHGALRLKLALNSMRLFAAEREIRSSVDLVADISADDREEWERLGGAGHSLVVPPVWIDAAPLAPADSVRDIDVLFVGNLHTPNNVEGLRWLTSEVLPMLRSRLSPRVPGVVFAGSEPGADDLTFWRREGVHIEQNPRDVSMFYPRARVIVNPLQRGSGVNLKMVEAFTTGRPVVATPAAVRGLAQEVRSHYAVCETPQAFALALHEALCTNDSSVDPDERAALVERCFGTANLQPLIRAVAGLRAARGASGRSPS